MFALDVLAAEPTRLVVRKSARQQVSLGSVTLATGSVCSSMTPRASWHLMEGGHHTSLGHCVCVQVKPCQEPLWLLLRHSVLGKPCFESEALAAAIVRQCMAGRAAWQESATPVS